MELFLLYFWLKLDAIHGWLIGINLLIGILLGIGFIITWIDGYDKKSDPCVHAKKWVVIFCLLLPINVAMPSKTDVAILVGANYAFKAAETPEAEKVMQLLRAKANEMLDAELLKATQPKKVQQ